MSARVLAALKKSATKRLNAPVVATAVPALLKAAAILVFDGELTSGESLAFRRFLVKAVKTRITRGPKRVSRKKTARKKTRARKKTLHRRSKRRA